MALEKARGMATGYATDAVKSGIASGYEAMTSSGSAQQPLSASEQGRLYGQRQASYINTGGELTQGAMDVGFSVAKKAAQDPLLGTAVRVTERGAQIGRQGVQTATQFSGANSAFIDANQALKPWETNNYNNGYEGQRALSEMTSSMGRSYSYPGTSSGGSAPAAAAPAKASVVPSASSGTSSATGGFD
jgi:hypothetical protein